MSIDENCLSVSQTADSLDAKRATVRKWLKRGKFPNAYKKGGVWLIPSEDVSAFAIHRASSAYKPQGGRPQKPKVISPRRLAEIKGVSIDEIWRLQNEGLIPRPCTEDDL